MERLKRRVPQGGRRKQAKEPISCRIMFGIRENCELYSKVATDRVLHMETCHSKEAARFRGVGGLNREILVLWNGPDAGSVSCNR